MLFQEGLYRFRPADDGMLHAIDLCLDLLFLSAELLPALLADQSHPVSLLGKPKIRIVLAEQETVFRPGGHHPVWFSVFFRHQVVDQNADIAFGTVDHERLFPEHIHGRVYSGKQSLGGGLLISGAAVDLSAAEKAGDILKLQRLFQLRGIDAVIFNGVGVLDDLHMLESGHRPVHGHLDIVRERTGHSADVHFVCGKTFRLDEDLVSVLIGEAHDLILDGRAVAGACPLDHA